LGVFVKSIQTRQSLHATVRIPGSKSLTHRALIASGLAQGRSLLRGALFCEDTVYTEQALSAMGARIDHQAEEATVDGVSGRPLLERANQEIFLGNSGTSMRLMMSVASLCGTDVMLTGSRRMLERPIGELVTALGQVGVRASYLGKVGCPPVLIHARGISGGRATLSGRESSQYVSSLLLAGPFARKDLEVEVKGPLVSRPYVDMTVEVMEAFGVRVLRDGYHLFHVDAGQAYRAREYGVLGDASNASYFWAAAAVTGGEISTENIHPWAGTQGDLLFLNLLEQMGCRVERGRAHVVVSGGELTGIEVDMGAVPDLVPTLASVGLFAEGKTVIRNISHLRHKESDRVHAIGLEWERLGAKVEELEDGLIIHGNAPLKGCVLDPRDDHRLAMSMAVIGLKVEGIAVENEGCVAKSFPGFWGLWDSF
jgi:3-phosphoshikimate 1-carboxyvinyltransferase